MTTKTQYCNMVVFDQELQRVLVLTKLHGPAFLLNKDNFPGGHIEDGETPQEGAIRETMEETNVQTKGSTVVLLRELVTEKSVLHTFAASVSNQEFEAFQSTTDEPLRIEVVTSYLASLALEPERAASDVPSMIQRGIELLAIERAQRLDSVPTL